MATGGSVLALKYEGGVVMASDTLLSYGSLAKTPNVARSVQLGPNVAMCASGDYADFQAVARDVESLRRAYVLSGNEGCLKPIQLFTQLQRTCYQKRCDFQPALCTFVVIGLDVDTAEPFLGVVDSIGTHWTAEYAGTVLGRHMAVPLLRHQIETHGIPKSRDEATRILEQCMRVLFYRECRAMNRIQVVDVSRHGVQFSEPYTLDTDWEYQGFHFDCTAILRA